MRHYDEETIELYLLGSETLTREREKIQSHLEQCVFCYRIYEELSELYMEVNGVPPLLHEKLNHKNIPAIYHHPVLRKITSGTIIQSPRFANLPWRILQQIWQHPAIVFSSGIAMAIGIVLLLNIPYGRKDTNPDYKYYNEPAKALEFYNTHDEKLWAIPMEVKVSINYEGTVGTKLAVVTDLEGIHVNRIVTTYLLPSEQNTLQTLRAFDGTKRLLWEVQGASTNIDFRTTKYTSPFSYQGVLIVDRGVSTPKTIITQANNGRSPCYIENIDHHGKSLGRYWHYGILLSISLLDVNGDGRDELIAAGINDIEETGLGSRPVLAVLLPDSIKGESESSATRGFGHPASPAEWYYIRFPENELSKSLNRVSTAYRRQVHTGDTTLRTNVEDGLTGVIFEYIFDRSMRVKEVKYDTKTVLKYSEYKKQGKLNNSLDSRYLESLRSHIEYWNGNLWTLIPTPVYQSLSP